MKAAATTREWDRFHLIVNAPALFNAIVAGIELGVFAYLAHHPQSSSDRLRDELGLPAHQLRVLLFALCTTGLLRHDDGLYSTTPLADESVVVDGEEGWRDTLLGWQAIYYPAFQATTDAVRSGTNVALNAYPGSEPTLYQRLAHRPDLQEMLHRSMTSFTLQSMPGIVDNLNLTGVRHVVDVGGGDGITARRLAQANPEVRFTVVDTPGVSEIGMRRLPPDLADRITFQGSDIFADPFPTGADCVLFSHCLEVFDEPQILHLLGKAHETLAPGGRVAIYGYNAADDEQNGLYSARLSLYLNVLATGRGMSYPATEYERWLLTSGFSEVHTVRGLPYEHGLCVGRKNE